MKRKILLLSVSAAFIVGAIVGGASGALFVTWKVLGYETDAMAMSVAESTYSVVPAILALNSDDQDLQFQLFEAAARTQLNSGISALHASIRLLSEERRKHIQGVLKSISANREKLSLGEFDNPPKPHIEEILAQYSR